MIRPIAATPEVRFERTDAYGRPARAELENSVEEIRAMVQAAMTVLARHNRVPAHQVIRVQLTDVPLDTDAEGRIVRGRAWVDQGLVRVQVQASHDATLTAIIHEYLHLVGIESEWAASTLTQRFKPEISHVAQVLIEGYYRGAAYLAHTQPGMSYAAGDPATYNEDQWEPCSAGWSRRFRHKARS